MRQAARAVTQTASNSPAPRSCASYPSHSSTGDSAVTPNVASYSASVPASRAASHSAEDAAATGLWSGPWSSTWRVTQPSVATSK